MSAGRVVWHSPETIKREGVRDRQTKQNQKEKRKKNTNKKKTKTNNKKEGKRGKYEWSTTTQKTRDWATRPTKTRAELRMSDGGYCSTTLVTHSVAHVIKNPIAI